MVIKPIDINIGSNFYLNTIRNIPIVDLVPKNKVNNIDESGSSIFETIFSKLPNNKNSINNLLTNIYDIQESYIQYNISSVKGEERETNEFKKYLEFPNEKIETIASTIVEQIDSNDEKMEKIIKWVYENVPYEYDITNYKKEEHWAIPSETLRKGSGDCEDQAFLIHSLALNAGVPWDQLRTYGGIVAYQNDVGGLSVGGHGWTAYKRETDNAWVVLDTTFFPDVDKSIENRIGMKDDFRYAEDYFFVNAQNTVDTPYSNGIRNPEKHENYKGLLLNKFI